MGLRDQLDTPLTKNPKDGGAGDGKISGAHFFIGWLLGLVTGLTMIYSLNLSAKQIEEFHNISYLSCFSLASIGAIFMERKRKIIHLSGLIMFSISIFLFGVEAALLVNEYSKS